MSDDLVINLISGIFGAAIALILRELFTWKGQGRIEAIRKYDLLMTEFYGKLIPLIEMINPDQKVIIILNEPDYRILRESQARFKHRIPQRINELLEEMFSNTHWFETNQRT